MFALVAGAVALSMALAACAGGPERRTRPREQGAGTVEVSAIEYAFEGVPGSVPPGRTTFSMRNAGEEPHMIFFARIEGTTKSVPQLLRLSDKESRKFVEEIGGIEEPVGPGEAGQVTLDLDTGRYVFLCFVSAPDGDAHYAKGMFGELTVE